MQSKLFLGFAAFLILCASAFGTSIPVRGSGAYGTQPNIDTGLGFTGNGLQEEVVCDPMNSDPGFVGGVCSNSFSSPVGYDLLLAITSASSVGSSLTITLPSFIASATGVGSGTFSFGVLGCSLNNDGTIQGNAPVTIGSTTFCTATQTFDGTMLVPTPLAAPASTCETSLTGMANGTDSVTLSGGCITTGMVFYFDESSQNLATTGPTPTPEPSALALLGTGLLALLGQFKRRTLA